MINFFKEKVELNSKDDVIKLHMIIKSYHLGYNLSRADIETLYELYKTGYGDQFYKNCLNQGFFKTKQTIRNSIGRMTNLGILWYKKRGERFIEDSFVPRISEDQLIFQYLIGNIGAANGNQK